jgi:hypothetical protein
VIRKGAQAEEADCEKISMEYSFTFRGNKPLAEPFGCNLTLAEG